MWKLLVCKHSAVQDGIFVLNLGSFPSHQVVLGEVNLTSPPHPLTLGCVGGIFTNLWCDWWWRIPNRNLLLLELHWFLRFFWVVRYASSRCRCTYWKMPAIFPFLHPSILFVQLLLPSDQGHDLSTLVLVLLLPTPQKFRMRTRMLHLFLKKSAQICLILSIQRGPPIICQVQQGISHARQVELSEQRQREELLGRITVPWMSPNWKCSFLIDSQWLFDVFEWSLGHGNAPQNTKKSFENTW